MTDDLKNAAKSLQASLQTYSWFRTVGIGLVDGADGLIVYISSDSKWARQHIPPTWEGFVVSPRKMSRPVPMSYLNG